MNLPSGPEIGISRNEKSTSRLPTVGEVHEWKVSGEPRHRCKRKRYRENKLDDGSIVQDTKYPTKIVVAIEAEKGCQLIMLLKNVFIYALVHFAALFEAVEWHLMGRAPIWI